MATKTEQIEALLTHRALELATRELGVTDMSNASYGDVFTVTRKDIDEYVDRHGMPRSSYYDNDSPTGGEGLWLVRRDNRWHVFFMERGQEWGTEVFDDEETARARLLDFILTSAGTGLSLSDENE